MENMNSIASLIMVVIVNGKEDGDEVEQSQQEQKSKKLWGMDVCHNKTPRFVPFPLRYACEFLMQVFPIHVNKEFELESQIKQKNILRTKKMLCDMLLRNSVPLGIITQTPNIMDLVKYDGATLVYQNHVWRFGVTPAESQIFDLANWLCNCQTDYTGLSTDSLHEAGYPGIFSLCYVVCGMAVARITSKDMLFWFRSPEAIEIRWGGERHDLVDKDAGLHLFEKICSWLFCIELAQEMMDDKKSSMTAIAGKMNREFDDLSCIFIDDNAMKLIFWIYIIKDEAMKGDLQDDTIKDDAFLKKNENKFFDPGGLLSSSRQCTSTESRSFDARGV